MRYVIASLLCAFSLGLASPAYATNYGVQDRVINLPQDQNKWYLSVVGSKELIVWFNSNESLRSLKSQVHFCPVVVGSDLYNARYKSNVKGLPTIRLQHPDGTVVYEKYGEHIPTTPTTLYTTMATIINKTPYILPYRRNNVCPKPEPTPAPDTTPGPDLDPVPEPLDDGAAPVIDEPVEPVGENVRLAILLAIGCAVAGAGAALVVKFRKEIQN